MLQLQVGTSNSSDQELKDLRATKKFLIAPSLTPKEIPLQKSLKEQSLKDNTEGDIHKRPQVLSPLGPKQL